MKLTDRNIEIAYAVLDYTRNNGRPPAIIDLCKITKIASKSTVHGHLKRLKELNIISWVEGEIRSIQILDPGKVDFEYEAVVKRKKDKLSEYIL
ncbi:MAG: LexA family protein [Candidatus Pristimantibacillus sp.]